MGDYQSDMSSEKRPPSLLPEGNRLVEITEMIPDVSKNGNQMMTTLLTDVATKKSMTVWLVNEKGKRWLLKTLLVSCGLPAGQDGIYDWSPRDVLGKKVVAVVEHFTQPWINREGESVQQEKAKVLEFLVAEKDATGNAWEE
jgi:hypothetical protein